MSAPPSEVAPNELVLFFDTNDRIEADRVAAIILAVSAVIRHRTNFGRGAEVEILEISTGTMLMRVGIILGALGSLAGIGSFSIDLETRLKKPGDKLAQAIAATMLDDSVVSVTVITRDRTITMYRNDLPAVRQIERRRATDARLRRSGGLEQSKKLRPAQEYSVPEVSNLSISKRMVGKFKRTQRGLRFKAGDGAIYDVASSRPATSQFGEDALYLVESKIISTEKGIALAISEATLVVIPLVRRIERTTGNSRAAVLDFKIGGTNLKVRVTEKALLAKAFQSTLDDRALVKAAMSHREEIAIAGISKWIEGATDEILVTADDLNGVEKL